jgi:hypothetical protein
MDNIEENLNNEDRLTNLPVQTENIAFKTEELITCTKCQRTNPPNRFKCFYCAAELEISPENAALINPNLRKLESWEKGFNLIYNPQKSEAKILSEISKLTHLEKEIVQQIIEAKKPFPIVRGETEKEVTIVKKNLQRLGMETVIISDESLLPEKSPVRLRSLEFWEDKLVLVFFNTDEITSISREDLALVVAGNIFENKTESVIKRKKGASEVVDASETASDESLLDLYTHGNSTGYRIYTKGFDFSCLETEKGILSADNLKKLAKKLIEFAPNAKFVNDYLAVRENLSNIWEIEQKKDSQGLKRKGFGKFDFSNVASSSNLQQFTKYSRLQWQIL